MGGLIAGAVGGLIGGGGGIGNIFGGGGGNAAEQAFQEALGNAMVQGGAMLGGQIVSKAQEIYGETAQASEGS